LEGGPPGFPQDSTCPVVLGNTARSLAPFAYGAFTLCGAPFQAASARCEVFHSAGGLQPAAAGPATPRAQRLQAYTRAVWAVPLSLATTQGISVDFFSSGY